MKIFLLAAGNDIHSVRWANQLQENGNQVHLCYLSNHKPSSDKFNKEVKLHELRVPSPAGYYLNVVQLKKLLQEIGPDIFNVHYASGYGTLGRLVKYSPYLLSVYGSDVYDFPYCNKLNMHIIKKNLKAADELASTSKAMALQVSRLIGYSISESNITPFGVDVNKFCKFGVAKNDNQLIIGSIKKLAPKYGMKYGILAIDYLVHKILPSTGLHIVFKYYIYGDGAEKKELVSLVAEKKLEHIVEFKGKIPNEKVPNALNEFDIFLGNSILDSESFGVAIVEAMACEVPVIVTDVDGFKEVVDYGYAGIIVRRKDYIEMANRILDLIKDFIKRENLGKIERKRVIENYNWVDNVQKMERIYKNLVD